MSLLFRLVHFERAGCSQDDERTDEELINRLTPYELLEKISDALELSGIEITTKAWGDMW